MENVRKLSNREVLDEVRNFDGILGAVEYGITSEQIEDPELANAWRVIERHYGEIRPMLSIVGRVLANSRKAA